MQRALCPSALIPPGFIIERASTLGTVMTIVVVSASTPNCCPVCGTASHRTHSRYVRKIADLPLAGCAVKLLATVWRFRCDAVRCGGASSPSGLPITRSRHGRGEPGGLTDLSTILVSRWAVDLRPVLPVASCCRSAMTRSCESCGDTAARR